MDCIFFLFEARFVTIVFYSNREIPIDRLLMEFLQLFLCLDFIESLLMIFNVNR